MSRKIAVYGKGGIGKSTVSANLTAALSERGVKVMQIGCDPKHDSTRALIGGRVQNTVLEYLKTTQPNERKLGDVVTAGYRGCLCVEAGGPEPGVGCAGRGIISAFELLDQLGIGAVPLDLTLYDVLGDVVCGGFAVPLRDNYADTVYIVTSGEYMAIYAANNIIRGVANYNPDRIGGIIFNSRGDPEEEERVEAFSQAVGIPIIARFARSNLFMSAEQAGKTVVELYPDSPLTASFRTLAEQVLTGTRHTAHFLSETELEHLILGRQVTNVPVIRLAAAEAAAAQARTPYSSRNSVFDEPLNGCAFSGAASVCTSVAGLTTLLHAPRSCAQFTIQLDGNCNRGAVQRGYEVMPAYADPDTVCTDMREQDLIFGGARPLTARLEEEIARGRRNFAIITACPPGIIGDDVRAVATTAMRDHPGIRVAVLDEDGNAAGDFMQGVIDAGVGLVRTFAERGPTRPACVNLVGTKTMSSSCQSEVLEVTALLTKIGVTVNCVLPGAGDLAAFRRVPQASANLMLNGDIFTRKLCQFLKDEYGVPTLTEHVRAGIAGTADWLRETAAQFDRSTAADALMTEVQRHYAELMTEARSRLAGRTCCIITISREVDWITETAAAAGLQVRKAYLLDRPEYTSDLSSFALPAGFEVIGADRTPAMLAEIDALHPDILITPIRAQVDSRIYQSRLPTAPPAAPYAGRLLAEDWLRGMLAPQEEGWRQDAAEL